MHIHFEKLLSNYTIRHSLTRHRMIENMWRIYLFILYFSIDITTLLCVFHLPFHWFSYHILSIAYSQTIESENCEKLLIILIIRNVVKQMWIKWKFCFLARHQYNANSTKHAVFFPSKESITITLYEYFHCHNHHGSLQKTKSTLKNDRNNELQ